MTLPFLPVYILGDPNKYFLKIKEDNTTKLIHLLEKLKPPRKVFFIRRTIAIKPYSQTDLELELMSKGIKEGSGVNKKCDINDANVGCDESGDSDRSSERHYINVKNDHAGSGGGVPVSQFGEFVSQQHAHRNEKFKNCFKVNNFI